MKLGFGPPRKRAEPTVYQPPSAVDSDAVESNTSEGPVISPPSFTTSTSIPKPAMPARDRRAAETREPLSAAESRPSNQNGLHGQTDESSALRSGERRPVEAYRQDRPSQPASNQTFALSSASHTDPLDQSHMDRLMSDNPRVTAKLVIERGGRVGKEFPITGIETNIGRWDADSGIFPDVDLDEDDPEAKVSRRHARILNHNNQYFIEDLGSTNGTFVNRGRRLLPGKRQSLQNGDEIIVGKTFLKFQILR
ncbi:MAG TPA: FHA domain-containing protein [Blastocatellia bacterium]|nr:FHA domain-containing protein [Blastocatellia bacterium]